MRRGFKIGLLSAFCILLAVSTAYAGFSGSIRFHQKGGTLTYQVFVENGKVTSGYQSFGTKPPFAKLVGGWYDGRHLVVLGQFNGYDITDQYFSFSQHFRLDRGRNMFILEQALWGYKKTMDTDRLYTQHDIDEIRGQ